MVGDAARLAARGLNEQYAHPLTLDVYCNLLMFPQTHTILTKTFVFSLVVINTTGSEDKTNSASGQPPGLHSSYASTVELHFGIWSWLWAMVLQAVFCRITAEPCCATVQSWQKVAGGLALDSPDRWPVWPARHPCRQPDCFEGAGVVLLSPTRIRRPSEDSGRGPG